MIQIHLHSMAYCFLFLQLPDIRMVFNCASRVVLMVAGFAGWRCTKLCLCCCCVTASDELAKVPVVRLDSSTLAPGQCAWGTMTCCCGQGEADDNEKKWEVLRNIYLASSQNGMSGSQLAHSTQEKWNSMYLWVADVPKCPAFCSKSVRCYLFVARDTLL